MTFLGSRSLESIPPLFSLDRGKREREREGGSIFGSSLTRNGEDYSIWGGIRGGGADAPTLGDDGGRRGTWQATLTPVLDSRSFAVWSICAVPHPPRYTPPPILPCPAQLAPRPPPYSSLDATRRRFSDQPELFSPSTLSRFQG